MLFKAILLVTSYVGHDEVRAAHRSAISAETLRNLKVARIFLLAAIPKKEKFISQNAIANENKHFNDILQGKTDNQIDIGQTEICFLFDCRKFHGIVSKFAIQTCDGTSMGFETPMSEAKIYC